uniref:Peptidase S54 rhomboid domain-containing protein n=1 Tax=Oryza glumipatula TaxID=40148 RepID=A0A0D9YFB4_9ORYZ
MATGRRLLQFQSLLAQQALRLRAAPRPKPQPNPHHRFLHAPSSPAAASPSRLPLWRSTGSLLPAGSLELFSLQRRRSSGWFPSSSMFLSGVSWAKWLPSADGAVLMLVGANVGVFMLWHLADPSFMRRHFMISLDNFKSGRLHTLLTNAFSHAESGHLISNMIGLYFFGSSISNMFGPAFLLKLYVAGALAGSAFFLLEKAFLAPRRQFYGGWDNSRTPALGASAAANAIILLDIFLYPKKLVYLYFFIPIPAAIMGAILIGADLLRVKRQGQVSGTSHLGGALIAALAWARIRKGWI